MELGSLQRLPSSSPGRVSRGNWGRGSCFYLSVLGVEAPPDRNPSLNLNSRCSLHWALSASSSWPFVSDLHHHPLRHYVGQVRDWNQGRGTKRKACFSPALAW